MISKLEFYCILKLDAISNALCVLSSISTVVVFLLLMAGIISVSKKNNTASRFCATKREIVLQRARILRFGSWITKFFKLSVLTLCFSLFFWVFYVLTPTTNQMAAIMFVPKIATIENIDTLTDEAKSIYRLAKEYFRKSVQEETGEKTRK